MQHIHARAYDSIQSREPDCMHAVEVDHLWPHSEHDYDTDDLENNSNPELVVLSDSLIAVSISNTTNVLPDLTVSYGVVAINPRSNRCMSCTTKVTSCVHVKAHKLKSAAGTTSTQQTEYTSISTSAISYPLNDQDRRRFVAFNGHGSSDECVVLCPNPDGTCEHGHSWHSGDPIEMSWTCNTKARIHAKHFSTPAITCYRPSTGDCSCRKVYDGRHDLILNLDNDHLFDYVWLFDLLV